MGLVIVVRCFKKYRSLWFLRCVRWNPLLLLGRIGWPSIGTSRASPSGSSARSSDKDSNTVPSGSVPSNDSNRGAVGVEPSPWHSRVTLSIKIGSSPAMGPKYLWLASWFQAGNGIQKLDDGWPESEKDVFQAALSMVVVKNSRWMVGEFYMSYGGVSCEK